MQMTTERIGEWSQTAHGRMFFPMDPRPEEVHIDDIAHALALQCRFGGSCSRFYSVAEHCVHMARAVSPENAMWALLHDASEAYIVDVPRPIKKHLAGYSSIEQRIMFAVCDKFGLPRTMPREVKQADDAILLAEADQIMGPSRRPGTSRDRPCTCGSSAGFRCRPIASSCRPSTTSQSWRSGRRKGDRNHGHD